ncbi:multicopper oxidase domain-containing protein [Streptomyces globisporus]|uniref:multicopper oxidase domain-containing protein n=1 Tax=Streptomyces globisporus TaxID=1908 RepID=UPI0034608126
MPGVPDRPAVDRGLELPEADDAVPSRHFEVRRSGINGQPMAMDRIDETVTRGTTEVWTLRNGGDMTHNFHVHDVQFRVLDVNGERPEPALRGRKDTVAVPMGATVRIALRFDGPADPDVPYMYHRHLLSHEDDGVMGQFVVVEKGQRAGEVPDHAGH